MGQQKASGTGLSLAPAPASMSEKEEWRCRGRSLQGKRPSQGRRGGKNSSCGYAEAVSAEWCFSLAAVDQCDGGGAINHAPGQHVQQDPRESLREINRMMAAAGEAPSLQSCLLLTPTPSCLAVRDRSCLVECVSCPSFSSSSLSTPPVIVRGRVRKVFESIADVVAAACQAWEDALFDLVVLQHDAAPLLGPLSVF